MTDKSSSESKQQTLLEWLWGSIGFFAAVLLAVGYFGENRGMLSLPFAAMAVAVAAVPLVAVTALLFAAADGVMRKAYVLRFVLTALFVAAMYAWNKFI